MDTKRDINRYLVNCDMKSVALATRYFVRRSYRQARCQGRGPGEARMVAQLILLGAAHERGAVVAA